MTRKIVRYSVIELPRPAVSWLWSLILKTYINKPEANVPEALTSDPQKFWNNSTVRQKFYTDFAKITRFKNSGMRLHSRSKEEEFGDIPINYLRDHFINYKEKLFQEDYLNKIIFYITEDIRTAEYNTFFKSHAININTAEPNRGVIPPGLKNLEGYWIGLNRNLEDGGYAKCFYKFVQVDNIMQVQREAYNAEITYEGYVHVQDDSNYLIDLEGKTRGKKKFIIADAGKLKPQSIRCLSSGFDISTGNPIMVKELLLKLPKENIISISHGFMVENENLENYLETFFDFETLPLVMSELDDFLGKEEAPNFSINDLSNIKKRDLEKINLAVNSKNIVAKKISAYIHFNRIDAESYSRNIIKYHKNISDQEEVPVSNSIEVFDEYLYITQTQYEHEGFIKHRVHAEAEDQNGAVDIQSLFPILENDSDNDLNEPILKYSNRIMDAYSDTFVSSATIINDFSESYRIPLKFDCQTLKSEIVFDFCSVPHFVKKGPYIHEIIYLYNEADGESLKMVKAYPKHTDKRGYVLRKLDKSVPILEIEETFGIDKVNEGIFSVKIDFISDKDEVIYFQFKFK